MGTIRMETVGDGRLLVVQGRLGIQDALQMKVLLLDAYQSGEALMLDFTQAESLDLACAQVLCSGRNTFERTRIPFRITGVLPAGVIRSLKDMAIESIGGIGEDGRTP